jgi:hypothetical protein
MTDEELAGECLDALVGETTCLGFIGPGGRAADPNTWKPAHPVGRSYQIILAAIREAVAAERERVVEHLQQLADWYADGRVGGPPVPGDDPLVSCKRSGSQAACGALRAAATAVRAG